MDAEASGSTESVTLLVRMWREEGTGAWRAVVKAVPGGVPDADGEVVLASLEQLYVYLHGLTAGRT